MTLFGYPSPLQYCGMVLGVLVAGLIICSRLIKPRGKIKVGWVRGAKSAGIGALVFIAIIILSIAVELGGLINVVCGGWLALLGAALAFVGTRAHAHGPDHPRWPVRSSARLEILIVAVVMGAALFATAFALNIDDGGAFVSFVVFLGAVHCGALPGRVSWAFSPGFPSDTGRY